MKNAIQNPFKFGGEVSGYQFYDRIETAELLRTRLLSESSNIVMFAPRRYGKTSLVAKVLRQMKDVDGIRSILFDLSMVQSLPRFCEEYVNAVYAMAGCRQEYVHKAIEFLAHCNPTLSIGIGGVIKIKLDMRDALSETSLCDILDLPERLAEELGVRFVIAFDEFQEVSEISRDFALEQVFRSRIQKHQKVRYVFFGSKSHLLQRMFCDRARPFYNSALTMPLAKPPEAESREFIRSRFADAGVFVDSGEVDAILRVSDNIPYYIQAISSFVFENVSRKGVDIVAADDVVQAVEDLVGANANYYSVLVQGLSDSQRIVVRALAAEPVREFDEKYRMRHELPSSSTLHSALKELIRDAIVDIEDDQYRVCDPLLAHYLLRSPGIVI